LIRYFQSFPIKLSIYNSIFYPAKLRGQHKNQNRKVNKQFKSGFIGEAMEEEDIDNVVVQGEPSPEEIAESDREGIRIAAKEVNYDLTPAEIEDIRKAMLKSLILKIVAANSLVPDNVKEDDFETILALYTNVLSNMLKK